MRDGFHREHVGPRHNVGAFEDVVLLRRSALVLTAARYNYGMSPADKHLSRVVEKPSLHAGSRFSKSCDPRSAAGASLQSFPPPAQFGSPRDCQAAEVVRFIKRRERIENFVLDLEVALSQSIHAADRTLRGRPCRFQWRRAARR